MLGHLQRKWIFDRKQGFFSHSLAGELKPGRHTLKIIADGKTFKREVIKTIEVMESLVIMEKELDLNARTVMIKLRPAHPTINIDRSVITVNISQTGKKFESHEMDKVKGLWQLLVKVPKRGQSKIVNFSVMTTTTQGDIISPNISPLIIDERLFDKVSTKEPSSEPIKRDTNIPNKDQKIDDNEGLSPPVNWIETSLVVVAINIFLIISCFFGFKFVKKQVTNKQAQLLSRLD